MIRPSLHLLSVVAFMLLLPSGAAPRVAKSSTPLFEFRSSFWLNLHHYLHALGRTGLPLREDLPAEATEAERATWHAAIESYRRRYGDMALLFDEPLIALKALLMAAPSAESLRGSSVRPEDATVLEAAAPVYRRHVWLEHDAANVRFVASVQPLLARFGDAIAARVARSYDTVWPATGVRADLVHAIQPGARAYTTNNPTHISIDVGDTGNIGLAGLEMLFREASDGWCRILRADLHNASDQLNVALPRDLPHAVLTFNTGEIVRRVLAESGITGYRTGANKRFAEFRPAIDAHWPAFLDGRISRREALRRILQDVARR